MKKIYTLLAAALVTASSAFALAPDVSDDNIVLKPTTTDGWAVFAGAGNVGSTFTSSTGHVPSGAPFSYSMWNYDLSAKDVWLSSPAMELTEGMDYYLQFQYQTWSNYILGNLDVYIAEVQVTDASGAATVSALTPIYNVSNVEANSNNWVPVEVSQSFTGSGTRYVVFHVSGDCKGRFSIADVYAYDMAPALPAPLAPTGLTAVPVAGEIAVNLSWTLPTLDDAGSPLTGDNAITAVDIYRDGEKVTRLEGAVTTFTDTEATGLTPGAHSYSVSAVSGSVAGALSEAVEVANVGPWTWSGNVIELSMGPAPENQWSYSRNNDGFIVRTMSTVPSGAGVSNSIQTWNNEAISGLNAWISSPRLDVPAGCTFKLSFWFRFNPNSGTVVESLKGYLSPERATDSETSAAAALNGQLVFETSAAAGDISSNEQWQKVVVTGLTTDETPLYLNFNFLGNVCKGVFICGLELEEYVVKPFTPAAPSNLTATAAPNQQLEVALSWTNPTVDIDGVAFTDEQTISEVYIYRDDFETPAVTLTGNVNSFTDNAESGLTPGAHSYKVKVAVGNGVSNFSNEASVVYVGPAATQSLPWTPALQNLTSDEFSTLWISYSPSVMAVQWTNRPVGIFLMNNNGRANDTWLISAPLAMSAGSGYKVSYRLNTSATEIMPVVEIGIVDSTTPSNFLVANPVVFGEDTSCTLDLSVADVMLLSDEDTDYRLAIRDHSGDTSTSYSLSLISLTVEEDEDTGISGIAADGAEVIGIYDLSGRLVNADKAATQPGVYVVRYSNGKAVKMINR